mmetsp:Transcript_21307/g.30838  ORF Transcript_21307/g.30838 Transcript_21307/m.30838 type:complete len:467 (+) Transcript_21307:58-1458(+)
MNSNDIINTNPYDMSGNDTTDRSPRKRRRTNYSLSDNKTKIEHAVKYLLECNLQKPNVRAVAERRGIPYNTLRDHYKKAQGLMPPPRRTQFEYPILSEYTGPPLSCERKSRLPSRSCTSYAPFDSRRRGRKPVLPRLVEFMLKVFTTEMGKIDLPVDRTQLKQVAFKLASDLEYHDFKATDMWLQAFQARHDITVANGNSVKRKGWRLHDIPVYGSSNYGPNATTNRAASENSDPASTNENTQEQVVESSHKKTDDSSREGGERGENGSLQPVMTENELRHRAVASFRSILSAIQQCLHQLPETTCPTGTYSTDTLPSKPCETIDVMSILPAISECVCVNTPIQTQFREDVVASTPSSSHQALFSHMGGPDSTAVSSAPPTRPSSSAQEGQSNRVLSLSMFTSDVGHGGTGSILSENNSSSAASALAAAQALYQTPSSSDSVSDILLRTMGIRTGSNKRYNDVAIV